MIPYVSPSHRASVTRRLLAKILFKQKLAVGDIVINFQTRIIWEFDKRLHNAILESA